MPALGPAKDSHKVVRCEKCSQLLRFPTDRGPLTVTCPRCRADFRFRPGGGSRAGVAVALVLVAGFGWVLFRSEVGSEPGASPVAKRPERSSALNRSSDPIPVSRFPLGWRLGPIDPRFGVSEGQVQAAVQAAVHVWHQAAGQELFRHDAAAGFPIALEYDERQEQMNRAKSARQALRKMEAAISASKVLMNSARDLFERRKRALEIRHEAHRERMEAHNAEIARWNGAGGAPEGIASSLNAAAQELNADSDAIQLEQYQVEEYRKTANRRTMENRNLTEEYNLAVERFNRAYGSAKTQKVGECIQRGSEVEKIAVYAFEDTNALAVILAHELGHALGIGHVEGEGSLMSEVEKSGNRPAKPILTSRDRQALRAALDQSLTH